MLLILSFLDPKTWKTHKITSTYYKYLTLLLVSRIKTKTAINIIHELQ